MVSLGQAHETELTLARAGATEEFWTRLAQSVELAKAVVALVMNRVFRLAANIERDMMGWKCREPVEAAEGEFEPLLYEFFADGENWVGTEEVLKRAKEKGISSGLRHLEAMLREQYKIPVEWRKYCCFVSTEIWLSSPNGERSVWCLEWNGEYWYLSYIWLGLGLTPRCRLLSSRKCSK